MRKDYYKLRFIGDSEMKYVPFKHIPSDHIYKQQDEELVRGQLCTLQKIGNGAEGCRIVLMEKESLVLQNNGDINKDQFVYMLIADVDVEDIRIYNRYITKRSVCPIPERSFLEHLRIWCEGTPRGGESCPQGFCNPPAEE